MKTLLTLLRRTALAGLWLAIATGTGFAQVRPEKLSAQGYWTVETNQVTKEYSLVCFFDAHDQLIYEERLEGISLDITRKKTVKLLNQTLRMVQNHIIVARQLKNYQSPVAAHLATQRD